MTLSLPPDPYRLLGVSKDAKLPEIRSAHRKLVLKCHPDKVQDPALKAIKQDEFQKVQQAYEILSDDGKRIQYDESVKLFELRKEMGKGNPTPRSNPFEFQDRTPEVRNPEPRPSTYTRPTPVPRPEVYTGYPTSRSHEDVHYDIPIRTEKVKKSTSYESADGRRRTATREGERDRARKQEEEERAARERWEKENKKSAHTEKKKSRDKEKRRGTDDKYSSRGQPYVEDDDSDDYQREKKSSRHREEYRIRPEERAYKSPHISPTSAAVPLTPKWDSHSASASEYIMLANAKAKHTPKDDFRAPPMRRAETMDPKYTVNYAARQPHHLTPISDDEQPRRSSGRSARRPSEEPVSRSSKESRRDPKRSPSSRTRDAYIVEPPSPPMPSMKAPKLTTHSSAPPVIASAHMREKPSRSKTQDYPREHAMPPLPRASTFQAGDRDHGRSREKGGSRLKTALNFDTDSESDSPVYASARKSQSPQRPPLRREDSRDRKTTYVVGKNGATPVTRHREEMRNIDDEPKYARDRSPSPRQSRAVHSERPPLARNLGGSSSRPAQQRSQSQAYYEPPVEARSSNASRPKMPARGDHYFGEIPREVKYAPQIRPENIQYSAHAGVDPYRRGSDPSHHAPRDYAGYPTTGRGHREGVYA